MLRPFTTGARPSGTGISIASPAPPPPRQPTNNDRFLAHLHDTVPELRDAITESEQRWGGAHAFDVCETAARCALSAYQAGDDQVALRIVTALLPALDEESAMYAPSCVVIAFLENEAWHDPALQGQVDLWPTPIRTALRAKQAHQQRHRDTTRQRRKAWNDLFTTGGGRPLDEIITRLRDLPQSQFDDGPESELNLQLTARVISTPYWLYRHPVDSLTLAWRYRATRTPWRTIRWLHRPRFLVGE